MLKMIVGKVLLGLSNLTLLVPTWSSVISINIWEAKMGCDE